MKELLKQYCEAKADQSMLNALLIKYQEISYTTTIEQALKVTEKMMLVEAIEIVESFVKELNPPEQLGKPLWAVIPKDCDDDTWAKNRGPYEQIQYYMFTNKDDAEKHSTESHRVVPVWGE